MKKFLVLLMLCAFVIIISCNSKKEIPEIRIGHAPHDHHATLYVAAAKGEYFKDIAGVYLKKIQGEKKYQLFKKNRLLANVTIDSSTGGIHLIRKLDEKILDVSFGGVPAMIGMIDTGSRIKILAPVMTEGAALVVNKDMPVRDWSEFIDYIKKSESPVKIGYKVDVSVQNLIFESALNEENISFSKDIDDESAEVILINLHGPKNLIPSLEADIIDGFVVMQPFPALAEYKKAGKIVAHLKSLPPEGKWNNHPCCALAAGEDFIKDQSEITEALVKLFYHANEFIGKNSEESAEITAKWLGTPISVEENSLPTINYINEYNNEWDRGVEFWISSLIDKGLLTGKVKSAYEGSGFEDVIYDKTFYNKAIDGKNK